MPNANRPGIKSAVLVGLAFGAAAFAFVGPTVTVLVAMLVGGLIGIAFGNVRLSMLALLVPTVAMQACVAETTTRYTSEPLCEPGRTEVCACPDGGESAQVCNEYGDGWGECECGGSGAAGSSGSSDAGARCAYLPPSYCSPMYPDACNDAGICSHTPGGWCDDNEVALAQGSCAYDPPNCRLQGGVVWCCKCD